MAAHLGLDALSIESRPLPFGAGLVHASEAWVLLGDDPRRSLGPAMAWSMRAGASSLQVMVDDPGDAAVVARRAGAFREAPKVWRVDGRTLVVAEPAAPHVPIEPSARARDAASLLHQAGVDVVTEHGDIRAEVRGLEIARVIADDTGEARVDVGVGRHDREAFAMVHGTLPTADALASVISSVDAVRRPEAEPHPLRQLAPEGWLRWQAMRDPSIVGAVELRPAEATVARTSVKDSGACIAFGRAGDGSTVVVALSVGIDLDLIPSAADARMALDPDARLVVVAPERDLLPITRQLGALLLQPAEFVALAGDWRVDLEIVT